MSSRGVYCDIDRHSCEGRNPENSVPSRLDARFRGHDEKNTPTPQLNNSNSVILKEDSMFGIGLPELTILLVIVLIVFGAGKLPAIGAGVGKSIRSFKNAVTESDKSAEKPESQ
jgi:sec-independent protein translocase protein TatA